MLLVGEKGVGDWQVLEYELDKRVKSPDFPVILVLLEGQTAPGLPFLRRLHWIITPDPSSEKDVARLLDAASGSSTRPGELWRYTSPYRGLAAMEEKDSDYFFGRGPETVDVLSALAAAAGRLLVLLGNSGVGKSSLAQAGVLAALKRQAWPEGIDTAPEWPHAFRESRRWCFLTLKPGTEPLKALVETFFDTWQLGATDPERVKQQNGWIELLREGKALLRDLLDATENRYKELDQTKPPAFLLYVDQGEELYVRAEARQRQRFSEVIAQDVADPRLYTLMSMRTDFLGELQKDEPLYEVHRQINVPGLLMLCLVGLIIYWVAVLAKLFPKGDISKSVLTAEAERALKPGDKFHECASCPEMVVVPAGSFIMGSPANEAGRGTDESPQHKVIIRQPFAVGKFELTFGEWSACVAHGGCKLLPPSGGDAFPVANVTWDYAKQYVDWISELTG